MKKLQKLLAILIGFVLVFSFSISCAAETEPEAVEEPVEEEVAEEPKEEQVAEEEVTESVAEEGKIVETKTIETEELIEDIEEENKLSKQEEAYIRESIILGTSISSSMTKIGEATTAFANNEMSITEHKIIAEIYIEEIKSSYDIYLDLEPTERFEKSYEVLGKAMDHYLNSATYMQSYVDTDNMNKMVEYIEKTTDELKLGTEYTSKATSQMEEIADEIKK